MWFGRSLLRRCHHGGVLSRVRDLATIVRTPFRLRSWFYGLFPTDTVKTRSSFAIGGGASRVGQPGGGGFTRPKKLCERLFTPLSRRSAVPTTATPSTSRPIARRGGRDRRAPHPAPCPARS